MYFLIFKGYRVYPEIPDLFGIQYKKIQLTSNDEEFNKLKKQEEEEGFEGKIFLFAMETSIRS